MYFAKKVNNIHPTADSTSEKIAIEEKIRIPT
jgi:hypothetical protein